MKSFESLDAKIRFIEKRTANAVQDLLEDLNDHPIFSLLAEKRFGKPEIWMERLSPVVYSEHRGLEVFIRFDFGWDIVSRSYGKITFYQRKEPGTIAEEGKSCLFYLPTGCQNDFQFDRCLEEFIQILDETIKDQLSIKSKGGATK